MFSIGSNQSSKRWELLSIAGCEGLGLLITFFMAWSPARHQRRVIRGWSPRRLRHLQFLPTQRRDRVQLAKIHLTTPGGLLQLRFGLRYVLHTGRWQELEVLAFMA